MNQTISSHSEAFGEKKSLLLTAKEEEKVKGLFFESKNTQFVIQQNK